MKRLYKQAVFGCALFFGTLLLFIVPCVDAEISVPVATNLQTEAYQATRQRLPILLAFSAIDCSYCEQLEEDFLEPILLSGDYSDRIIVRKLHLDDGSQVVDFGGTKKAATALSDHYRVFVTPTILFLDAQGNEIAQRMVGYNTPELFGGYLDDCILTALYTLREPAKLARLPGCRPGTQD